MGVKGQFVNGKMGNSFISATNLIALCCQNKLEYLLLVVSFYTPYQRTKGLEQQCHEWSNKHKCSRAHKWKKAGRLNEVQKFEFFPSIPPAYTKTTQELC